jgi:alanine racemase
MVQIDRRKFLKATAAASVGLAAGSSPQASAGPSNHPRNPTDPWLEINLNHIGWNLSQIRQRVNNRPVMGVIKANAYGHGLVETAKFLEKKDIAFLAVGKLEEALLLRENLVKTPVLNFGSFSNYEAEEIVRRNISQSVYTDDFALLSNAARG